MYHFRNLKITNCSTSIYTKSIYSLLDFYERLLIPVLHTIGDQWTNDEIEIATEHVCSNAAITLIDLINQKKIINKKMLKVYHRQQINQ